LGSKWGLKRYDGGRGLWLGGGAIARMSSPCCSMWRAQRAIFVLLGCVGGQKSSWQSFSRMFPAACRHEPHEPGLTLAACGEQQEEERPKMDMRMATLPPEEAGASHHTGCPHRRKWMTDSVSQAPRASRLTTSAPSRTRRTSPCARRWRHRANCARRQWGRRASRCVCAPPNSRAGAALKHTRADGRPQRGCCRSGCQAASQGGARVRACVCACGAGVERGGPDSGGCRDDDEISDDDDDAEFLRQVALQRIKWVTLALHAGTRACTRRGARGADGRRAACVPRGR
jgi:hypothetical protein